MELNGSDLETLAGEAMSAAEKAAEYICSQAGRGHAVHSKPGGGSLASQAVTEVDFQSQSIILDCLDEPTAKFGLGLLTEEQVDDASRHRCDYFWCIDPLDGTLPFTEGVDGYSVSIALVRRDGTPVIGVIVNPVSGTSYRAVWQRGSWRNGSALTVRPDRKALTFVTDRSFASHERYEDIVGELATISSDQGLLGVEVHNQGGAAMNACWVIERAPAVYFKFPRRKPGGGSLWDFAASACLFAELDGLHVSDITGRPLNLNPGGTTFMNRTGVLYASDQRLADGVLRLYRKLSGGSDYRAGGSE